MHRQYASMPWLCLGIATVAVLGHICAFSFHAHASELHVHLSDVSIPLSPAHDHEDAGGADPDADHSIHSASCDAIRPAPRTALPVLPPTALVPLETSAPVFHGAPDVRLSVVSCGPSLFLLHASLLI